jgi:hypothetical protein
MNGGLNRVRVVRWSETCGTRFCFHFGSRATIAYGALAGAISEARAVSEEKLSHEIPKAMTRLLNMWPNVLFNSLVSSCHV